MDLVLLGAGGHCRSCVDVAEEAGWKIAGFISPEAFEQLYDYARLGDDNWLLSGNLPAQTQCLIAVGQVKSAHIRRKIYLSLRNHNIPLATVISPRAYVSQRASIAEGSVVMHGAVVNASARISENCIINSLALIEHDTIVGAHVHISTGARVNGGVSVGNGVMLGSGAVILPGLKVADDVVIGAGSLVTQAITEPGTLWCGTPARKIK